MLKFAAGCDAIMVLPMGTSLKQSEKLKEVRSMLFYEIAPSQTRKINESIEEDSCECCDCQC